MLLGGKLHILPYLTTRKCKGKWYFFAKSVKLTGPTTACIFHLSLKCLSDMFLFVVCCVAVKNCLECRQRCRDGRKKSFILNNHKMQEIMLGAVTSTKV